MFFFFSLPQQQHTSVLVPTQRNLGCLTTMMLSNACVLEPPDGLRGSVENKEKKTTMAENNR